MLIHKPRLASIGLLGVIALGLGAMVLAHQAFPPERQGDGRPTLVPAHADNASRPTVLHLSASTEYDPSTVTIVRTPFHSRVEEVLVHLGAKVERDDPLLKLFSTDLAAAKSEYELARIQWNHDKKVLDYQVPLAKENTIPERALIDAENNEAQSRLKLRIAKDKLLGYGLTEEEIANATKQEGPQKGRMVLRSGGRGVVAKSSVVPGIYYPTGNELMVITPLDHLWVCGNVSELDAQKIELGQKVKVVIPSSDRAIDATIDYIDKAIDAATRSARFRTQIANLRVGSSPGCTYASTWISAPRRSYRTSPMPPRRGYPISAWMSD
jgi:cobalt-zinc-cadmium efflux system membrane fusion protein